MKTIKITLFVLLIALIAGTTSCIDDFGIEGNGHLQTEQRWATYFDEVSSSGSFEVYVLPGDEPSIEITAESNLLPYIETDIDGNRLKIRTRGIHDLDNHLPMEIYITSPNINKLKLSGSGLIQTGSFLADEFEITLSGSGMIETSVDARELKTVISGSGKIRIDGYADHSDMNISGSGQIDAYDLLLDYCSVNISGSGDAYVNVEKMLDVSISGSGDVLFINTPDVHSSISGGGKVINDN